jgi:hypothetical protein
MTVLDEIGQTRRRLSDRLTQLDVERKKLSDQLNELEITERAVKRFGGKAVAGGKPTKRPALKATSAGHNKRRAQTAQQDKSLSLSDASLQAVQAHGEGASANEVLNYLTRKLGMTVRPNHLGMALQRHRRAGRLEHRDQRWYLPAAAKSKRARPRRDRLNAVSI